MGLLLNIDSGETIALWPRHRVGRSRASHTRLREADVSGDHALIAWSDGWTLRDLGSRNGTSLRGALIEAGRPELLRKGDEIGIGGARFRLIAATPPTAAATAGSEVMEGDGSALALPSFEDPAALFEYEDGWVDAEGRPVEDGARVQVAGTEWTLSLPGLEELAETRDLGGARDLARCSLHFGVSADEEYVEVTVRCGGEALPLKPKAHHYVLLTLARARLGDVAEGEAASAAGWLHTEDLQRMLRSTRNQIYLAAHRTKKELAALGIVGAEGVVERRTTSQQLRIGVADLVVETI